MTTCKYSKSTIHNVHKWTDILLEENWSSLMYIDIYHLAQYVIVYIFDLTLYFQIRVAVLRLIESVLTKISGRPQTINILYYQQHKGEVTSCASNVRLINGSPSQTTVQCCPSSNGITAASANTEGRKASNSHIHLMVCDQVSTLWFLNQFQLIFYAKPKCIVNCYLPTLHQSKVL